MNLPMLNLLASALAVPQLQDDRRQAPPSRPKHLSLEPSVKWLKNRPGSHSCLCGRTISANKVSCLACAAKRSNV